jgi:primosomal protein N' (replication factor Y)
VEAPGSAFASRRPPGLTVPIARVALPLGTDTLFDYWAPASLDLAPGSIVRAPLGPRTLTGVVVELADSSSVARAQLHNLERVVPLAPLPEDVIELVEFASDYYQESRGLVYALAVPPLTGARVAAPRAQPPSTSPHAPPARAHNAAQRDAIDAIVAGLRTFSPFLLYGITGSGKTEVYFAAAGSAIAGGGQVLLLVPEINLTPQLEERVREALPGISVATLHSGLPAGTRNANWRAAAAGTAQLVLGTRLAVFAPLPTLALVVVDEEQDGSYKQQDNVRYNARDLAVWRARRRDVPVVLGSATPSLESWRHAQEGRYRRLDLPRRADPRAALPAIRLVPAHAANAREGIGDTLHDAIAVRLARGEQSLVFVNRRGYAPSLLCASCHWAAQCPRCSARLVAHRAPPSLRCHHCGHVEAMPAACPECGNVDLLPLGHGTQRLERVLAEAFPQARIARVDRDTTRARGAFDAMRAQFDAEALDLLIGTQMLAKGHDFPRLTLVGVVGADNALYSADFRATERLGALLLQVAGRAGRASLPGEVIVQTDFPEHPVYAALRTHAFEPFAASLLEERRLAGLPPFVHAALLAAEAHDRGDVDRFLAAAHAAGVALVAADHPGVEIFKPVPALLARRAGFERAQIVVRDARRAALQRFLAEWRRALVAIPGRRVRWSLDVDPAGFA